MHVRISRILLALLTLWATLPLLAQSNAPSSSGGETTPAKVEVFAGYSWMNLNDTVSGFRNIGGVDVPLTVNLKDARNGFVVAPSLFFNRWIGLTLDGGGHWGDNYTAAELMIGPTVRFPMEHIQPFIHALGGWSRIAPINTAEQNTFGFMAGGGIDLKVARHLNIRLAEADYIRSNPNWPGNGDGARLSAGLVFLGGVGQELPAAASCSVDHNEVWAGEPVKASVRTTGFDPKHTLNYDWTTNGGKVEGQGDTVNINTTGAAEGQSYTVSAHVTDPKNSKKVAGCQATFATKKRLPPQITCSANPSTVTQGDALNIHSDASSPQGGNLSVAVQSSCGASGQGTDVAVRTNDIPPGPCRVTCTVTDDHQLTAQNSTSFTVNPKKVCPTPTAPAEITLRSVYFATAIPTAKNPDRGLIASQQETLNSIATSFKQYMAAVQQANQGTPGCAGANLPEPKLYLQGFADPRGGDEYNQKLSERRVAIVQRYLEGQGIPSGVFVTQAFGKSRQLSNAEVKAELDKNPELNNLTPKERARILKNMRVIELASNRRVDIGLNAPDQNTVREYPFRAADWLTLIGGREKPPIKKPGTTTKKPSTKKPSTKGGTKKK